VAPTPPADPPHDLAETHDKGPESILDQNASLSLEEETQESEANDGPAGKLCTARGPPWKSFHDRLLAKTVAETKPFFKEVDQKWVDVANQLAIRTANTEPEYPLPHITCDRCKARFYKREKMFR
jgi:hypothetical protein